METSYEATDEIIKIYKDFYNDLPFVDIVDQDTFPKVSDVVNTNKCKIALNVVNSTHGKINLVIFSVIDNLVKGASGQAIQNMNIMFNLDETSGLI